VWPPRRPLWKKMWNKRWQPRNGFDNSSIANILILAIQVNLCVLLQISVRLSIKFNWIVVIKNFAIELLSWPFLGCYLWFYFFFHPGILGLHIFFTACCFCLDITSICNCVFFFLLVFFYYRNNALLWRKCCIQNLTVLVSFYFIILINFHCFTL